MPHQSKWSGFDLTFEYVDLIKGRRGKFDLGSDHLSFGKFLECQLDPGINLCV